MNNATNDAIKCNVELKSVEDCIGKCIEIKFKFYIKNKNKGEDGEDCSIQANPLCKTTSWSDWSPCSTSCDEGVRVRTRLFYYAEHEQANKIFYKRTLKDYLIGTFISEMRLYRAL